MEKEPRKPVNDNCCILLFAKSPAQGQVKTRLADSIGPQKAAQLYACMVLDTIACLKQTNIPFEIFYWPDNCEPEFRAAFGSQYDYVPQQGRDLSQRMINAFRRTFERGIEYAVTIGTDIPDIPAEVITEAFKRLKVADSVIGPADDGGYYLLGFSKKSFTPEAFVNISWSTPKVLPQTIDALVSRNKTVSLVKTWHDIDTIDDLKNFVSRRRNGDGRAKLTMAFSLKEMFSVK